MNDYLINDFARQRHADLLHEALRDVQRARALRSRGRRGVRQWFADVARVVAARPAVRRPRRQPIPVDQRG